MENKLSRPIKYDPKITMDLEGEQSSVFDIKKIVQDIENKVKEPQIPLESSSDQSSVNQEQIQSQNVDPDVSALKTSVQYQEKKNQRSFFERFCSNDFQKLDIKHLTSKEDREKYESQKIRIIRLYIYLIDLLFIINFILNTTMTEEDRQNFKENFIDQVRFLMIIFTMIAAIISHYKNKYLLYAFIPLSLLQIINLNYHKEVLKFEDLEERNYQVFTGLMMFQLGIFNTIMINELLDKYAYLHLSFSFILNYLCLFRRLFGSANHMNLLIIYHLVSTTLFFFIGKQLVKLDHKVILEISQKQGNILSQYDNLKEFQILYNNLDVGILVAQNNMVEYTNEFFKNFMQQVKNFDESKILDLRVFKCFKKTQGSIVSAPEMSTEQNTDNIFYSLRDLLEKSSDFLNENIFRVSFESCEKYIQLKIKTIVTGKQLRVESDEIIQLSKLVQLVDISDKILYNEVKAEHTFLEMINAAVSHELRNPLNSLIGQVCAMKDFFANFKQVIESIESQTLKQQLNAVYEGLNNCSNKMKCASQFIDFFVHDVLDYTILNKDSKNFIKNCSNFEIAGAINEINHILEDKSLMKNINVEVKYVGFDSQIVKTDKKRFQQIILNLMSNALKFTDRNGKILLLVEKIQNEFLRVSVVDSGIGIKKHHQNRLFQMFGSIKDEQKKINVQGVGLGLVICKLIVNKFDGYIDFISKYKKGSTFFFTFKLEQVDQEEYQQEQGQQEDQPVKIIQKAKTQSLFKIIETLKTFEKFAQNRILVVDDEEFCISSMRAILFNLGIDTEKQVDFCMNGMEAIEMVKQTQALGMKYKLIFTDFNMPVMNGIQATKQLREILEYEPIIVGVTGYASSQYHQIGQDAGMNAVVSKPMYVQTLKVILQKYYQ